MVKNYFINLAFIFLFISIGLVVKSQAGDTLRVQSHNSVRMSWNGNYDRPAQFPHDSVRYRKVLMHLTLGCGGQACSGWDYTTKISLRKPTGDWDSTLALATNMRVNASIWDSACYSFNPTYQYFFDSAGAATDSLLSNQWMIYFYDDVVNPYLASDSLLAWPANYWNFIYNASGVRIDSVFVFPDSCLFNSFDSVYTPFAVHNNYEIARYITPYGGALPVNWNRTWTYDITDFSPILHDSVGLRAFYDGWSDGFNITLDFEFILGTPPRDVKEIIPLWNGGWAYGNAGNSIENYLVPRAIMLDTLSKMAKVKVTTTGHGAGTQNCAEFCRKTHSVIINGNTFSQDLWRDDCDKNPLFPQNGTWLYDRANWCPGSEVRPHEYEASPYYTVGQALNLDYDMAAYTNASANGAYYFVDAFLFGYSAMNFGLDAEIVDIYSPSDHDMWTRKNPTCAKPEIVIRNSGDSTLTSVEILYFMEGQASSSYAWTGSLGPMKTATVSLPPPLWVGANPIDNHFIAFVKSPNGGVDEYAMNDTIRSTFSIPTIFPNQFVIEWRTNNRATETTWKIFDVNNNMVAQVPGFLSSNTVFSDTVLLNQGCYKLEFKDGAQDGLHFFNFSNQGGASCYINLLNASNGATLGSLEKNFGGEISTFFTISTPLDQAASVLPQNRIGIFPNPSNEAVFLSFDLRMEQNIKVKIRSVEGQLIEEFQFNNLLKGETPLTMPSLASGIYWVEIVGDDFQKIEKLVIFH